MVIVAIEKGLWGARDSEKKIVNSRSERHIQAFGGPSLGVLVAAVVAHGGADVGVPGELGDDEGIVAPVEEGGDEGAAGVVGAGDGDGGLVGPGLEDEAHGLVAKAGIGHPGALADAHEEGAG